ncbi:MAG TPA: hypothetical protein DCG75_13195 [Bacteroidales bacterium]|nr:hypothetical protein [Bacteroidales bacterium]
MKTLHKILGLFVISSFLIFTACEKVDNTYTGNGFIFFGEESITVAESSSDIITLNVLLADASTVTDLNVTIDVSLTAQGVTQELVEGVDFEVLQPADLSSITIPAGSNSAEIQIAVFDNIVEDSAKYITLTLASAGDYTMGYPGSGIKKTAVITISDDDCAMIANNWIGVPAGIETYSNWPTFAAAAQWAVEEEITPNKVKYVVKGLMNGIFNDWEETITYGGELFITLDNTDPLDPQVILEAKYPSPEGFDDYGFYANTEDTWSYYIIQDPANPSTFSTCNKTLTIHYLVDISTDGGPLDHEFRTCLYDVVFE